MTSHGFLVLAAAAVPASRDFGSGLVEGDVASAVRDASAATDPLCRRRPGPRDAGLRLASDACSRVRRARRPAAALSRGRGGDGADGPGRAGRRLVDLRPVSSSRNRDAVRSRLSFRRWMIASGRVKLILGVLAVDPDRGERARARPRGPASARAGSPRPPGSRRPA